MQNNNHTENPFESRQKTGAPSEIEDPFSKKKTITNEADMNVNKISTEEEIKSRKILKITGPKKVEEEESSKRLFVFNNNNKDNKDQTSSSTTGAPSLFSNPFQPKAGALFTNNTFFGATTAKTEEVNKTSEAENQPKLFSDRPINPFQNNTEKSMFKNPFTSNTAPSGGLFGSNTNTTGGSLFGNLNNPKPSGLFANAPSLFPTNATNSLFGNPAPSLFGSSNVNFNTNLGQKGFESSDEDGSDFEDPEAEVEINPKGEGKKLEAVKIEVNEKMLKIPCSEFFIYDFAQKKYISIGKGDFSIEFTKSDEKKENPMLIFRNSVLKILFQGIFKAGVTKLETVNKNFKTISVIQKAFVINEQTKKFEFKSVKIFHVNDGESKLLIESIAKLEKDAEQLNKLKPTESAKISQKPAEDSGKEEININQVNKKLQSTPATQTPKPETITSKKQPEDTANKNAEGVAKNSVININKVDNTSKPTSKQLTQTIPIETKSQIFSQNKNQINFLQKEKEAVEDKTKVVVASEPKGKLVIAENIPAETKIATTEKSQSKSKENHDQITIQVSTNQATGSKGLMKVASQAENEKPVSKGKVSESKDVLASQSIKPISVGKITNISIQMISSNKSQSQDKN